MKYPMGAKNEISKAMALNNFNDDDANESKFAKHFGSRYSTSVYVYYCLMREERFTSLLINYSGINKRIRTEYLIISKKFFPLLSQDTIPNPNPQYYFK